ncbi:VanW family protein [Lysinibacillus piscis]|uniref:VanW family protein n=1 Tax=Lysinibacillus piscis TaxID=2518931 RepID=UPI002231037F|nr:VanW family protein [Lysinibacillus sp. KH24]
MYPINFSYADQENSQSTIGGITVEGLTRKQLQQTLQEAVTVWTSEPIVISGEGAMIQLNASAIQYDIEGTIATYETMTKKPWYAFWQSERTVHLPLQLTDNGGLKAEIEQVQTWVTDSTYDKALQQAANLASHEIEADIANIGTIDNERIALEIQPIPEGTMGLVNLIKALDGQILYPQQPFSLVATLGEQVNSANNEALNFIASMLYSVALHTNSDIYERVSQNRIPSYLEAGVEAAITRDGSNDLKFLNTTEHAMKLKMSLEGDQVKAEAYAPQQINKVTIHVTREYEIAPRIITRYSKELASGQQQVLEEGSPGLRVAVMRYTVDRVDPELISKDYYAPAHRIMLKSSQPPPAATSETTVTPPPLDLNGDGLADVDEDAMPIDEEDLPEGSYYDKGGKLITPKP